MLWFSMSLLTMSDRGRSSWRWFSLRCSKFSPKSQVPRVPSCAVALGTLDFELRNTHEKGQEGQTQTRRDKDLGFGIWDLGPGTWKLWQKQKKRRSRSPRRHRHGHITTLSAANG